MALVIRRLSVLAFVSWVALGWPGVRDVYAQESYRKSITVDRTKVARTTPTPPTTLSNFPVLVSLTDVNLRTKANDPTNGRVENANGYDIIFRALDTTTCGGTAPCTLDHEIESYDGGASAGTLVAWVRLPSVNTNAASTDTVIYMDYGNAAISSTQENVTGVWDNNYVAVYHMENASPPDSANGHDGTGTGNGTGTGIIGTANNFDGSGRVVVSDHADFDNLDALTIEIWMSANNTVNVPISRWDTGGSSCCGFGMWDDGNWYMGSTGWNPITHQRQTSGWHYYTLVKGAGTGSQESFRNAVSITSSGSFATNADMSEDLVIGGENRQASPTNDITALIDEVRISKIARSDDWITTTYNNQNDPGDIGAAGFYTVGSEVSISGAALTGTLSDGATEDQIVGGGQTLIVTLSGDTWDATIGADNSKTTDLINGIDSAQAEAAGWDAVVKANLDYNDVVRTSDTVVTITLGTEATYFITATETITVTVPATAVAGTDALVATPTFNVTQPAAAGGDITYVRSGGVAGTSFSLDIGTAGTDRLVVVFADDESSGTNLTGATVDGKACNLVTRANNTEGQGNHQELWYCDEDDLGASNGTVTVAIAGGDTGWATHGHLYTGVDQTGPTDSGIDDTSVGVATVTVTGIDVPEDGLVVMGAAHGSLHAISTWTAPLVQRQNGPHPTGVIVVEASVVETSAQTNKTYVATFVDNHNRGTGIVAAWSPAAVTAATLLGTLADGADDDAIVAGGETLLVYLTGESWDATIGADNAKTTALISGIDSAQSESKGWDLVVKANLDYNDVVRSSARTVTITLGAEATYAITAPETITVTVPATAVAGTDALVATPTFVITTLRPFDYRKTITIDRTKVGVTGTAASTLSNYPLLYSVTDADLKSTGNGGDVTSVAGYDILFRGRDTTTCGGPTRCTLDHEIESYNPVTGQLVAWVRVPSVNTNKEATDTVVYIHYGNAAIISSIEDADGVWDANYVGVWHLSEDQSGTGNSDVYQDSTSNANHGDDYVSATGQSGQVGGGQEFDGTNDYVTVPDAASLRLTSRLTLSVWAYAQDNNFGQMLGKPNGPTHSDPWWDYNISRNGLTTDSIEFKMENTDNVPASGALPGDSWHHVVATWDKAIDSGETKVFIDGSEVTYATQESSTSDLTDGGQDVKMGIAVDLSSDAFDGFVDEARISNIARNADWIKTEYHNQNDPGDIGVPGFYTVGAEDASPLTAVELIAFSGIAYDRAVLLEWRTGYEIDNLGFHLYREIDEARSRLTPSLIGGSGLLADRGVAVTQAQGYAWWDHDASVTTPDLVYWLEDLDFDGTSTWHGPMTPTAGGHLIDVGPPAPGEGVEGENSGLLSRLADTQGAVRRSFLTNDQPPNVMRRATRGAATPLESQWPLAQKAAVKIGVRQTGWVRVTQPELVAAGLNPAVDPRRLQLFTDGIEQAITITGEDDGQFDPADALGFYGRGVDTAYTDTRVYWVLAGGRSGLRIRAAPSSAPVPTTTAPPTPTPAPVPTPVATTPAPPPAATPPATITPGPTPTPPAPVPTTIAPASPTARPAALGPTATTPTTTPVPTTTAPPTSSEVPEPDATGTPAARTPRAAPVPATRPATPPTAGPNTTTDAPPPNTRPSPRRAATPTRAERSAPADAATVAMPSVGPVLAAPTSPDAPAATGAPDPSGSTRSTVRPLNRGDPAPSDDEIRLATQMTQEFEIELGLARAAGVSNTEINEAIDAFDPAGDPEASELLIERLRDATRLALEAATTPAPPETGDAGPEEEQR